MNSASKSSWVDLSEFSLFQWVVSDIQLLPHDLIWLFVCWVSCSLAVCCLIYTRLKIFTLLPFSSPLYELIICTDILVRLEFKVFLCVSSLSLSGLKHVEAAGRHSGVALTSPLVLFTVGMKLQLSVRHLALMMWPFWTVVSSCLHSWPDLIKTIIVIFTLCDSESSHIQLT